MMLCTARQAPTRNDFNSRTGDDASEIREKSRIGRSFNHLVLLSAFNHNQFYLFTTLTFFLRLNNKKSLTKKKRRRLQNHKFEFDRHAAQIIKQIKIRKNHKKGTIGFHIAYCFHKTIFFLFVFQTKTCVMTWTHNFGWKEERKIDENRINKLNEQSRLKIEFGSAPHFINQIK